MVGINASVRRVGELKGRLTFPLRGGLERGGDDSPLRGLGSLPSSEAEMIRPFEGRSLPSSEAEARGAVEGFGREPSSEAEITPRVRGGFGWAALRTCAACWASLSPFLSSRLEGGCRPSWTQLPSMCLCF